MSNNKSFGFFYKCKENSTTEAEFAAHVNVWNISDKPFIDFGLLVKNYKSLDSIYFMAPFTIESENIDDLSHVLKEEEIKLIFNNSKFSYKQAGESVDAEYQDENNNSVILLSIKDENGNFLKHIIKGDNYFQLNVENFCDDINDFYVRFRIRNIESYTLLSTLSPKNNYLESAFVERQILDFKLNNTRTIEKYKLNDLLKSNYSLARFSAIHFFVMVPSDYEITTWGCFSECRQLEQGKWDNYLANCKLDKETNILAYHWKQKQKNKEDLVDEFAQLIKMEHKSTNFKLIFTYCAIVILLGSMGSGLVELIKYLFKSMGWM